MTINVATNLLLFCDVVDYTIVMALAWYMCSIVRSKLFYLITIINYQLQLQSL